MWWLHSPEQAPQAPRLLPVRLPEGISQVTVSMPQERVTGPQTRQKRLHTSGRLQTFSTHWQRLSPQVRLLVSNSPFPNPHPNPTPGCVCEAVVQG